MGCSLIAEIQMSDKETVTYYGAPTVIYITYNASSSTVNGSLQPREYLEAECCIPLRKLICVLFVFY